jgi:hypothetical protein
MSPLIAGRGRSRLVKCTTALLTIYIERRQAAQAADLSRDYRLRRVGRDRRLAVYRHGRVYPANVGSYTLGIYVPRERRLCTRTERNLSTITYGHSRHLTEWRRRMRSLLPVTER